MSAEFVFVLVTSQHCGFCTKFLTLTWDLLKEKLTQDGRFAISHLELVTNKTERTIKSSGWYNPSIMNYVTFFPSFYMIPASDWFNGKSLVLTKYNMYGVDESFRAVNYTTDIASLSKWVDSFTTSKPKTDLNSTKSRFNTNPKIHPTTENVLY
jgi:hypothetical protein